MKRIFAVIISVLLVISLTACGNEGKQDNNDKQAVGTHNSNLSSDFKAAMDSYESFIDEYVAFMEKYNANPTDTKLLSKYLDFMSDYTAAVDDFSKWQAEDLNTDELAYYLEVQSRVTQKLLKVTENIKQ